MAVDLHRTLDGVPANKLDVGFCHGDFHGCNVHENNGALTHFDFDCCGLGLRVFDLATFRWGTMRELNGDELWSSFLDGYRSTREIGTEDFALMDSFVMIRQIWWMALIMGNARDFGYGEASDKFLDRQLANIGKYLMKKQW